MSDPRGIAALEAALARDGATAAGLFELGGLKLARGDFPGAIAAYEGCRRLEPKSPALYNNLGTALIKAGRFDDAIAVLEIALALDPAYLRPLVNLGKALIEAGRPAEALVPLRESLRSQPDYVPALVNLGNALGGTGDLEGARAALERAVSRDPMSAEARVSLADVLLRSGALNEAINELRQALEHVPGHVEAHWHLGHMLFMAGRWEEAWPHLEYRLERLEFSLPALGVRWDGIVRPTHPVRLVGEQGLGDQIQFARYAPVLARAGVSCVLQCEPRLVTLFSQGGLDARVEAASAAPPLPGVTSLPLMSAPAWHRTTPDAVPFAGGYLRADPARVEAWRHRLPASPIGRVALAWAGNPRFEVGRNIGRSPPLSALAPLARHKDIAFISLQKGKGEDLLEDAGHQWIARLPGLDEGPDAFLDSAAVLRSIDLLVTSDTGIAHLAGALGVPTWLCLMQIPDWRWGLEGRMTPWYESIRIFRQSRRGDWDTVYGEVADELSRWRASRSAARRS